ncbi:MAG: PD-(D/E)XK nuclease family protein [candidate division WOR-3 bacterium]
MEEKIKIIHIDQPFLKVLARYFAGKFSNDIPDFSKILIVFPSERNKFYFRRYLLETIMTKGIIPPRMLTIEELIDFIYEKIGGERAAILQNIERNFILKKAIDDLKVENWQDIPFLKFISIGNRLLNFYDELSQEQVNIRDIENKSVELHFAERYIKNELPILRKVYQQYRENLTRSGYKDRIDQVERIYKNYDSKIFLEFDYVIIAGIAATTSFEEFIFKRMIADLPAEIIVHSGTPEDIAASKDPHKKFYLHYKLLSHLGSDINKIELIKNGPSTKPVVNIKALETPTKQTFYLGSVIRDAIRKYRESYRIGIVLTDDSVLFPITEMLKAEGIDYNLSAGIPFTNLIFYSFLKYLYDAITNNFHYKEFFILLQHPLIKGAVINRVELRPLVYGLRRKMIEDRRRYFQTEEDKGQRMFEGLEPGLIPLINFLKHCFTTVQQRLEFNQYIDNIIELLNDVLSYNEEIIKGNFPGIKEFFERLHSLAQLRIEQSAIPLGIEALEFILRILKDGRYHIEGEPLKGVQIVGLLESRNLDFDCIVLPSMNEGIFPRRSEKDMFINPALRKEMGLITEEERNNLYYYYFTQLTCGKKEVSISYVNEENGDIPSRFVIMLESEGYPEDKAQIIFTRSATNINEHDVKKDPKILKSLFDRFKGGLSHSSLRSYKNCPYQFYLQYIVGIKEPDAIAEEFDASSWGSLFHIVASEFYKNHYPSGFGKEQLSQATETINEILDKCVATGDYVALPLKDGLHFDIELYRRYLKNFLIKEIERFDNGYKICVESEEKRLNDTIEVNKVPIPLIGFVDRIDTKDESYYILDYKTGSIPLKKYYAIGDEFTEFQLPLYTLMFSKNGKKKIGGLVYYKIGKKVETREICEEEEIGEYLEQFKEKILIPTIEEMLDIDIPFYQAKNKDICVNCIFKSRCGRR